MLNPLEIESTDDSKVSWTTIEKSQNNMKYHLIELHTIPPEPSFQPDCHGFFYQTEPIILQDAQVPQGARHKLFS